MGNRHPSQPSGGTLIDPTTLAPTDQRVLLDFLNMADQAAAHFTEPLPHDAEKTHDVILRVHAYVKTSLYEPTGRTIEPLLRR